MQIMTVVLLGNFRLRVQSATLGMHQAIVDEVAWEFRKPSVWQKKALGVCFGTYCQYLQNATLENNWKNMAVCGDIFLFSFCLLDTGGLIFILIYFIITLSDLECDYLNAQECCSKLNFVSFWHLSATIIKSRFSLCSGTCQNCGVN